jgi:transcriptional regulator with XRE-family HTH domain
MTFSLSESVAAEVRAEMARQSKTQADLGRVLGLVQPAISLRLRGKRPFKLNELDRLARYFGVPISSLIRERAA